MVVSVQPELSFPLMSDIQDPQSVARLAGSLLVSHGYLAAEDARRGESGEETTLLLPWSVPAKEGAKETRHEVRIAHDFQLINEATVLGWGYSVFVWLRESNVEAYRAALKTRGFVPRWKPFVHRRIVQWNNQNSQSLRMMLRHIRFALAKGGAAFGPATEVDTAPGPYLLLTTPKPRNQVAAQFRFPISEFMQLGQALCLAYRQAALGEGPGRAGKTYHWEADANGLKAKA